MINRETPDILKLEFMNTKILAIVNQKGGVGKTTTSVNLAAALGQLKNKVLLLDLDPQGNATMGSGVDKHQLQGSMNDVLLGETELASIVLKTPYGYYLAPSNGDLTQAEVLLVKQQDRLNQDRKLHHAIQGIETGFEWIVIDCPPTLNMLTLNALVATHGVLIPMQCEYYALEGLTALLETIEQMQSINARLGVWGIVRTMHDPRNRLSTEVGQQLQDYFGTALFKTTVPRNVRVAEAPSHGLPVLFYDPRSKGALAYGDLAKELIKKTQQNLKKITLKAVDHA